MNRSLVACLLIPVLNGFLTLCGLAQTSSLTKDAAIFDEQRIRSLRMQSNKAIQHRDLAAFGETMMPEIDVTRGSGSHVSGRDSVLASVSVQFNDASFLGYTRITDSIQLSTSNPLAAEHGHWIGQFKRSDGIQSIKGTYLAMWRKTGEGWKIRSELFVSLSCTGSAACGK